MIFGKERSLKEEIIRIGKRLSGMRLVVGRSGNLSVAFEASRILVTATGTSLGDLSCEDIILADLSSDVKDPRLTSEFPLHSLIYKELPEVKAVLHCHPTLVNAYFAVHTALKALTFETRLYLGEVPVVEQDTPAISRPDLAVEALKKNNIIVIRNHGVVALGQNLSQALYLVETLEESVKALAVARLFKKEILDDLDRELKADFEADSAYVMFSPEHIKAIVELANKDEIFRKKGAELDLTTRLAIKMDDSPNIYKFVFEKGSISAMGSDEDAPFVISAPAAVWEMIFLGKLDPFVATTQGKMKLRGDLGKLSRWYVPFNRLFQFFRQVRIK